MGHQIGGSNGTPDRGHQIGGSRGAVVSEERARQPMTRDAERGITEVGSELEAGVMGSRGLGSRQHRGFGQQRTSGLETEGVITELKTMECSRGFGGVQHWRGG